MIISFTHEKYLFLLFIIPLLILAHFIALKTRKDNALKFANFEAVAKIKGIDLYSKNIVLLSISILIVVSMVLAVSGLTIQREVPTSSFSFIIAIDSSRSMEAIDVSPNRLEAAKDTAIDFIESSPTGTKIGIVSFSGNSLIEQGLTEDKSLLIPAVEEIVISFVGGTDLYEAISTSANLLNNEESKSIIIFSDGQSNVGDLDKAIAYANSNDIIIHAIGVGTEEGGETAYGISKLEEDSLRSVSYNTQGKFFRVDDRQELLQSLDEIMNLKIKKVSVSLIPHLLILSLILFMLYYVLANTKYRTLP